MSNIRKLSANPKAIQILSDCAKNGMTDKKIQDVLAQECGYKWTLDTIGRRRRAIGEAKGKKQKVEIADTPVLTTPPPGLSDQQRAKWFVSQFKKTHLFRIIQRQFDSDEVEMYLQDFGLVCVQFEDIVTTEFMQIDDFLKHRILINRQLILSRSLNKEIAELQTWMIHNPSHPDEDKESRQFRIMQQNKIDNKYKQLKNVDDRYDALVKERQRILNSMAATRRDRQEEMKGGKQTFLELVDKLHRSKAERDDQGKFAELTKIASEDIKNNLRRQVEFPDGSVSPIIMDSEASFDGDENE